MNLTKTQRLTILRKRLLTEVKALDETILDLETKGVSSVNVSTGDGSKSATNIDIKELAKRRDTLAKQLASVNRQLEGRASVKIVHRMTVRS